ncbi:alpha/beta fold hydrolase [Paenibacillus tepidiphilus]|uniref:alpha/beta fold hydrolase n=1 Tax=Paenibacillus tepidiphilus TaxID=2608683 RepID=UPI001EF0D4A9|nr:alpha/beta fold hydrolase [Paenibacillus tepidiphilus]
MKSTQRRINWKKVMIWAGASVVIIAAGLLIYLQSIMYSPSERAEAAMQSDDQIEVAKIKEGYRFEPVEGETTGPNIIIYPGGLVEPSSYSPMARKLAEKGHRVYIAEMPFNLAMFGQNKADAFIAEHPDESFVIGGHSLGGVFASRYAAEHTDSLDGVFFLASYADDSGSLTDSSLSALQITGTDDGVLNLERWKDAKKNLPEGTTYVSVEGGNHGQFGSYGNQKGDRAPEISDEQQWDEVVDALEDWFKQ